MLAAELRAAGGGGGGGGANPRTGRRRRRTGARGEQKIYEIDSSDPSPAERYPEESETAGYYHHTSRTSINNNNNIDGGGGPSEGRKSGRFRKNKKSFAVSGQN